MIQVSKAQPRAPLWAVLARACNFLTGAPEKAEAIAREILHFVPAEPHALLVLVSTMRVLGGNAKRSLETLVLEYPGIAAPHHELGLLFAEAGQSGAAVQCFSRVAELEPRHPTVWRALGDELARTGDFEQAKRAYGEQFAISVHDVLMLEQVMALGVDQIDSAGAILRDLLTICPTDAVATRMLGQMYMRADRCQDAEALFARAVQLAPDFLQARRDYAAALHSLGKFEEESRQLQILWGAEAESPGSRRPDQTEPLLSGMLLSAGRKLSTEPAGAAAEALQILRLFPGQQLALFVLACAHRAAGNMEGLRAAIIASATMHPSLASVQYELGLLLASLGERQEAIARLARVAALEPNHPSAWRVLGNMRSCNGDAAGAADAYAHQISLSVRELKLLDDIGARDGEDATQRQNMLRECLAINPTDVMTIRMLAQSEHRHGRNGEAGALLERALRLAPRSPETRKQYAFVLQDEMKWNESNAQFDIAIAAEPENAALIASKASNLVLLGEHDRALSELDAARDRLSDQPSFWLSYGNALRTIGKSEAAVAAYHCCIARDSEFALAWWALANMKTYRFARSEIEAMLALSGKQSLHAEARCYLEFSLGKAFEDAGAYECSFEHYRRGNELRRPQASYSWKEFQVRVQKIKSLFTSEFFRRREGAGCTSAGPIFIVGLPRAGSTLIEQILSSHSRIEGTAELPDLVNVLRDTIRRYPDLDYPTVLGELRADEFTAMGKQYMESTRSQRKLGRRLFTDKAPRNFQYIGLIHLILPNARIIDARRHPMACCFSGYKQCFRTGSMPHTYDLEDIGKHYQLYVELMAHYDAVLPGRVHRVIHEDLLRNPEAEIRRLLAFCGVAFEENCLRFHDTDRAVRTSSSEQVRRAIYVAPVDPWRHFEPWLDPLKAALGPTIASYPAAPDCSREI